MQSPAEELVNHLSHPNGWWRDKAQQLIVLHQDRSIVPQLEEIVQHSKNLLARFHALWCLEGLGVLDSDLIRALFQDDSPRMRIQALRASETLYKKDKSLAVDYSRMVSDPSTEVAIQAMLTSKFIQTPTLEEDLKKVLAEHKDKGVQLVGDQILNPPVSRWFSSNSAFTEAQNALLERGATIFNELCSQCHGTDGSGTPMGPGSVMAPPLTGSSRVQSHPDYVIKAVMHGLSGPIEGKNFPGGIMVGNKEQSDDWIAAVASFIRVNLSNEASLVTKEEVAKVRMATAGRESPYQYEELIQSVPQVLIPQDGWIVTASHTAPNHIGGTASPNSAFNFEGWTTGDRQEQGMWFQVELTKPETLTEIQFTSPPISRGWRPGSPPPIHTYPRAYEIRVSMDGENWIQPVAAGQCDEPENRIAFQPDKSEVFAHYSNGSFGSQMKKKIHPGK